MPVFTLTYRFYAATALVLTATFFGGVASAQTAAKSRATASTHRAPQVRSGRDAFLPYQVNSTDELVTELQSNSRLRRLYQQHFGIPENQVVDWVRNSLIVYRLPEARTVNTYGVTRTGTIYPVRSHLKKGERVWATRSGLPVLRWACANPLTKKLPGTLLASKPKPATPRRIVTRAPIAPDPTPVTETPALGRGSAPELAAPAPVAVDTSALAPSPSLSGVGGTSLPAGVGGPGIGRIGPGFLPIFLPLAGILAANPGGGGGGTIPPGTAIIVPIAPPPPAVAIPEPGTIALAAMVLPFGGLVLRRKIRRG